MAVAYFNDAEWKGWRPLLTKSNARMASAIRIHLGIKIGPNPWSAYPRSA